MSTIRDRDQGMRNLLKALREAKTSITVGIHGDAGPHDDSAASIEQIAGYNHEGTERIPARPFIVEWFDRNKAANLARMRKALEQVVKGKITVVTMLNALGLKFSGDLQRRIADGSLQLEPNAAKTIARKRSSKPLINTGQLRAAIRHKVEHTLEHRGG